MVLSSYISQNLTFDSLCYISSKHMTAAVRASRAHSSLLVIHCTCSWFASPVTPHQSALFKFCLILISLLDHCLTRTNPSMCCCIIKACYSCLHLGPFLHSLDYLDGSLVRFKIHSITQCLVLCIKTWILK